ncbi:MAG: RIP metalloprotease RseP [Flavobacteriales bacterium]|nr:RIP metalloprotease RseP [Flavobacteriales bacterium]
MEVYLIKGLYLILSLAILVILHELGHFIPAKLFKTRVEKFYLFFDPWFSLFKIKKGDTEYGIGWLPLGGYVKISGMIDESMDKEQMKQEPQPWEFRAKPAWQRLIIMIGGVTVNLLLAFFIYAMTLFIWGKQYLPVENAVHGVVADSTMIAHGFQNGDKILKVGDLKPQTFSDIDKAILIGGERTLLIERDGDQKTITLPTEIDQDLLRTGAKRLFAEQVIFYVDTLIPGGTAIYSELEVGDRIVGINGFDTQFFHDFVKEIKGYAGHSINLDIIRDGIRKQVRVDVNGSGKIGAGPFAFKQFEYKTQTYNIFQAFPAGFKHSINVLSGYVQSFKLIFTKEGIKQVGGFGAIGSMMPSKWGNWRDFWELTALLSVILAFMNILPIPALDGGHVMFLLYEMITNRKPSEKFLEYAQVAGMVILLSLVVYANGNDIFKAFN